MKLIGTHASLRLQHGPNVRTFRDVTVTKVDVERYELAGIEEKREVAPGRGIEVRDVEVLVGFLPEHVIDD